MEVYVNKTSLCISGYLSPNVKPGQIKNIYMKLDIIHFPCGFLSRLDLLVLNGKEDQKKKKKKKPD